MQVRILSSTPNKTVCTQVWLRGCSDTAVGVTTRVGSNPTAPTNNGSARGWLCSGSIPALAVQQRQTSCAPSNNGECSIVVVPSVVIRERVGSTPIIHPKQNAPIVYGLGSRFFTPQNRVRVPVGVPILVVQTEHRKINPLCDAAVDVRSQ